VVGVVLHCGLNGANRAHCCGIRAPPRVAVGLRNETHFRRDLHKDEKVPSQALGATSDYFDGDCLSLTVHLFLRAAHCRNALLAHGESLGHIAPRSKAGDARRNCKCVTGIVVQPTYIGSDASIRRSIYLFCCGGWPVSSENGRRAKLHVNAHWPKSPRARRPGGSGCPRLFRASCARREGGQLICIANMVRTWLRALFRRNRVEDDLDEGQQNRGNCGCFKPGLTRATNVQPCYENAPELGGRRAQARNENTNT
jgi:hypothetical protein